MSHLQNHIVSAHSLQILILGAFSLRVENAPVSIATRKTQSLLAYLALYPEAHPREKLAAMFWGDSADREARHSLRSALNALRKALGNNFLLTDRENIQRNPDANIWIDAVEFERIERLDDIAEIETRVGLYRGDLLTDFYDDWILAKREHYRTLYFGTLLRLARTARAQDKNARAMEYAQTVLQNDRANEQAYQELMLCHAARGDHFAALCAYEECVKRLRQELNVEPSGQTKNLYEWIRARRDAAALLPQLVTNLPIPFSSFIGRDKELRDIERLMRTTRLLTLTGAGGSGKTRLALQAARSLLRVEPAAPQNGFPSPYHDGAWWVELAPLTDEMVLPQAIANVLGVRETPYQPLMESLLDALRAKTLLLILDNCEHLVEACARLADTLLTRCPNLALLATSREALGLTGETIYQVPPLALPSGANLEFNPALAENESVRLFVERARAVKTDFALTAQNAQDIVHICQRLDGIPLAIELAAARVKMLTVQEIATRIEDRFGLLTGGSRAAMPRHQTLRATIDWSYQMLSNDVRSLFQDMAVLAGSFTLEAAQGIAAGDTADDAAILELLSQLVNRSLILAETREGGTRYRMLETIRQYALEKLLQAEKMERVRTRHLEFFLALAEQAEPQLKRAARGEWIARLEADLDNLRAALEWSQTPHAKPGAGVRLAAALCEFWVYQGYLHQGRGWLESVMRRIEPHESAASGIPLAHRAKALYALGELTLAMGDNAAAIPLLEAGVKLWRETVPLEKTGLANTLVALGDLLRQRGEPQNAGALISEAVAFYEEQNNQAGLAKALASLGMAMRDQEDFDGARRVILQSAQICRATGDEWGTAQALHALGLVAYRKGDYAASAAIFQETLDIARRVGNKTQVPYLLLNLGIVTLCMGNEANAIPFFQEGKMLFREFGNRNGIAQTLLYDGHMAMFHENLGEAEICYTQITDLLRQGVSPAWVRGGCLFGFAMVAAARGQYERAVRLWGAAETQMQLGASFWDAIDKRLYARTLANAEIQLGARVFETARAQGNSLSWENAIEYALQKLKP